MSLKEWPLERAFMFFEAGPVILVTTNDGQKNNLMTISWHMVTDFTPALALTTGPWNHSFHALRSQKECVLAVPAVDLMEKVVRIGDCSGKTVDKFTHFNLTPVPGTAVKAPLVAECPACLECQVTDYLEAPGIFLLQGVKAWVNTELEEKRTFHARGDGTFIVDGELIGLHHLMADKLPF